MKKYVGQAVTIVGLCITSRAVITTYEGLSEFVSFEDTTAIFETNIYLVALIVLGRTDNPDRLAYGSHGLRELMEKLPRYLDLPVKIQKSNLRQELQNLRQSWIGVMKHLSMSIKREAGKRSFPGTSSAKG